MSDTIIIEPAELLPVGTQQMTPAELFKPATISQIVDRIKQLSTGIECDLTTVTGRKKIASSANKVARSKTFLDNAGKQLVSTWKDQAKVVDAERKKMRDSLDALKEEIRRPLTEWENAEVTRVADIRERLREFDVIPTAYDGYPAAMIEAEIIQFEGISLDGFDEFADEATIKQQGILLSLQKKLEALKQYEADQAELAQLKKDAEERAAEDARLKAEKEQTEREDRIAKEAAEKAKKEAAAEAKAQTEKVEAEKQAAIRKQSEVEEEIERMKRQAIADTEAATKREVDRIENEKRLADIALAEKNERLRIEKEQMAKAEAENLRKAAEEERQANRDHQKTINNQAVDALQQTVKINKRKAQDIVIQIAVGVIPGVRMVY